ncbi:MAG: exodeoxyribonuclease V subunit gamma, partial [Ignavibacteria bacterium]|nr:exodeoxyribonuclease V subunit gamma [Ignavibacteria bacterium]
SYSSVHYSSYKKAYDDINSIIQITDELDAKLTPAQFSKKLKKVISETKINEQIISPLTKKNSEIEFDSVAKDLKALNIFFDILDEMEFIHRLLGNSDTEFSLNYFYEYLVSAISGTRYNIKEKPNYGVQITTPNEIRDLKFDILFIPGLVNGKFPLKYSPLIFLEEKFIRDERRHLLEERYLFYQELTTASSEIYLSYPLRDEKREFYKSDFLSALENVFQIEELDFKSFDDTIFTEVDLLINYNRVESENYPKDEELENKIKSIEATRTRTRQRKLDSNESAFNGIIHDENLRKNLESFIVNKSFSATEFETYAKCPFKHFLEFILEIEGEEKIEEDTSALEIGNLIHRILFKFFTELKDERKNFYSLLQNNFDELNTKILGIAKNELEYEKSIDPYFFLIEELVLGNEDSPSILTKFLENEKTKEVKLNPFYFEKKFEEEITLNSNERIKINTKIDRIDYNEIDSSIQIIDYKTGSSLPSKRDFEEFISLQIPLYIKLCLDILSNEIKNLKLMDALFLKIIHKGQEREIETKSFFDITKLNHLQLNEYLAQLTNKIKEMVDNIKLGRFHLTRVKNFEYRVCRYCGYKTICRVDFVSPISNTNSTLA